MFIIDSEEFVVIGFEKQYVGSLPEIRETTYVFSKIHRPRKVMYSKNALTGEEKIQNAEYNSRSSKRYCVCKNNCEHFCHKICIGQSFSLQSQLNILFWPRLWYLLLFIGMLLDDFKDNFIYQLSMTCSVLVLYIIAISFYFCFRNSKVLTLCPDCKYAEIFIQNLNFLVLLVAAIVETLIEQYLLFPHFNGVWFKVIMILAWSPFSAIISIFLLGFVHYHIEESLNKRFHRKSEHALPLQSENDEFTMHI